ncbi:hypothetical protein J132_01869 [Termitomyces sp. J132]|nr:hypothetical protein J132_01869 [Termitomyces sp. J132]
MRLAECRNSKFTSYLYSRSLTVNLFRFCWIVLVIWGDLGIYYWSLSTCRWPKLSSTEKPTRVLLVSDTQVQHPLEKDNRRMSFIGQLRRFMFDMNLRRSWHVTTRMRPQVVIFLGDMLASGRNVKDEIEYQRHAEKFKFIFSLDPSISAYHIPGNSDVGMGVSSSSFKAIRRQYLNIFGPFNQQVVIHNHTFLLIDAPGLVDEDYQRAGTGTGFDDWTPLTGGTAAFVKNIERDSKPLILISHIPLARPDSASCGPLREKGTIRRGAGHGYQNTLGKQTTAFLLQSLQPAAVYSDIREVTVKSFSTAKHIRYPGFQLISLINPTTDSNHDSFLDTSCSLPDQYSIYSRVYFSFFVFTMFTVFVFSLLRRLCGRISQFKPLRSSPQRSGTSTPEDPPESATTWSPYTLAAPCSPQSPLPSSLRTSTTHAIPILRVSRSATPVDSPLLPTMYYSHEYDDEEAMYPPQYAAPREGGRRLEDKSWSSEHNRINSEPPIPHFISAPGSQPTARRAWSYSWTFVLGYGRGAQERGVYLGTASYSQDDIKGWV